MIRSGAWATRSCACLDCAARRLRVALEPQDWARFVANHYDATEMSDLYALVDATMLPGGL